MFGENGSPYLMHNVVHDPIEGRVLVQKIGFRHYQRTWQIEMQVAVTEVTKRAGPQVWHTGETSHFGHLQEVRYF